MPSPKDPEKLEAYRQRMRAIALERGYAKWMQGRKLSAETVAKMTEKQQVIGRDPAARQRRSERAKSLGYGKWMAGRSAHEKAKEKARQRGGKTYEEIYGERAVAEAEKRRQSNRVRWNGVLRKPQRAKHNADYHYSQWRKAVFTRDNHTCRVCGQRGGKFQGHHIKTWARHPDLRFDVDNGLTVHEGECHRQADQQSNCIERQEAFALAGVSGPTRYQN